MQYQFNETKAKFKCFSAIRTVKKHHEIEY